MIKLNNLRVNDSIVDIIYMKNSLKESLCLLISQPQMGERSPDSQVQPLLHLPTEKINLHKPDPIQKTFNIKKMKYLPNRDIRGKNSKYQRATQKLMLPSIENKVSEITDPQGDQKIKNYSNLTNLKSCRKSNILNEIIDILKDEPDSKTSHTNTPTKIKTEGSYQNEFLFPLEKRSQRSSTPHPKNETKNQLRRNIFLKQRKRYNCSYSVQKKERRPFMRKQEMQITFCKPKQKRQKLDEIRYSLPSMNENEFI